MISLTIFSEKVRTKGSFRGRNKVYGRLATFVSQEKIWKIWHHWCRQESKAQLFSGAKLEILFNNCLRNMHPPGNARTLVLIIACRTDVNFFYSWCFQAKKGHGESFHCRMWSDRSVDLTPLKYVTKCLLQRQNVCISESLFSLYSLFCLSLFATLKNPPSLGFSPLISSCSGYFLKVLRHETLVGESYTSLVFKTVTEHLQQQVLFTKRYWLY